MKWIRIGWDRKSRRLALVYIGACWIFYMIPGYHTWLQGIATYYGQAWEREWGRSDEGYRLLYRRGQDYLLARYLRMGLSKVENPVVLLPPASYFTHFKTSPQWAEAKFWYYHVGKWPVYRWDTPQAVAATHTILFDERNEPRLVRVVPDKFQELLQHFQHPEPIPASR